MNINIETPENRALFEKLVADIQALIPFDYDLERNPFKFGETVRVVRAGNTYALAAIEFNWKPLAKYNSEFNGFGTLNISMVGNLNDEEYREKCKESIKDLLITLDITPQKYLELYKTKEGLRMTVAELYKRLREN
ncbi:hypothetical protein BNJ_00308 [Kaumoebavirus]|uniref:hypothetical protein n=1 Tax=Kaumoebavirus TaxID=1859492 RepID=UPI0009C35A94|nr:hypothetical protein BNJ_00308 [Kaumoebavirus]ARA72130.1 hypothetical protein BNJ_00308 [Kaumoebavirus]